MIGQFGRYFAMSREVFPDFDNVMMTFAPISSSGFSAGRCPQRILTKARATKIEETVSKTCAFRNPLVAALDFLQPNRSP